MTTHSVNEENSYKEKDFIIFSPAFVLKDQINHELHFLMYFVLWVQKMMKYKIFVEFLRYELLARSCFMNIVF